MGVDRVQCVAMRGCVPVEVPLDAGSQSRRRHESRSHHPMAGAGGPHLLDLRWTTSSGPPAPAIVSTAPGRRTPGASRAGAEGAGSLADDLVESNLGFVFGIAAEYRNLGLPLEDLVNEGNIGLLEAARRFDPARGTRFITYAVWWIRKAIRRALTRTTTNIYVPEYQLKMVRRLRTARSRLSGALGREADREEISRELGVEVAKIDRILQLKAKEISLDDAVSPSSETALSHFLVDRRGLDPEDDLIRREGRELLRRALLHLTDQQRTVVINRFGLGEGPSFSLSEIGRRLGVSRERIRQIEEQGKKRLRKFLSGRALPACAARNPRPAPAALRRERGRGR
jgi:RNA polymerase primary sigma factor